MEAGQIAQHGKQDSPASQAGGRSSMLSDYSENSSIAAD